MNNAPEDGIHCLKGCVLQTRGNEDAVHQQFIQATRGIAESVQAIFYYDLQPDKTSYQGLAWIKLGEQQKADTILNGLFFLLRNN